MDQITTIGLDISKNVFDVHGVSAEGTVVLRETPCLAIGSVRSVRRSPDSAITSENAPASFQAPGRGGYTAAGTR